MIEYSPTTILALRRKGMLPEALEKAWVDTNGRDIVDVVRTFISRRRLGYLLALAILLIVPVAAFFVLPGSPRGGYLVDLRFLASLLLFSLGIVGFALSLGALPYVGRAAKAVELGRDLALLRELIEKDLQALIGVSGFQLKEMVIEALVLNAMKFRGFEKAYAITGNKNYDDERAEARKVFADYFQAGENFGFISRGTGWKPIMDEADRRIVEASQKLAA